MYIDKTLFQRLVYILLSIILVMSIIIIDISSDKSELPVHKEEAEEVESVVEVEDSVQQPVVYIVYINVESKPEEVVESVKYYDVPLSEELQEYIIKLCEERNVDPALIMAMIKAESSFNADAVGDSGNALGLMQIWPYWHQGRMNEYGCDDLLDPFQNVTVGIDIIADWLDNGKGVAYALMGYNGGAGYANEKYTAGEVSEYAQRVMRYMEEIKGA